MLKVWALEDNDELLALVKAHFAPAVRILRDNVPEAESFMIQLQFLVDSRTGVGLCHWTVTAKVGDAEVPGYGFYLDTAVGDLLDTLKEAQDERQGK